MAKAKRPAAKPGTVAALEVAVGDLVGRAKNPRRRLGDLAGLAASIKAYGILEPLVIRPAGKRFEVIAGHRRLAAAKLAKLRAVPCVIRNLNDLEASGAALVENIQREGLEPIDEGDAIAALIAEGVAVEEVAERLGRSVSYVAKRRQLAGLHSVARAAVQKGEVSLGVALQIARLPKSQHIEALEEVRAGMGEREAAAVIESRFLLRLADAPFSRTDAALVPKAGPCNRCPKRTGAQPALFDDVKGRDVCTDLACYQTKAAKAWERRAADHAAAGGAVIEDPAEIQKVLGWSDRPVYSSGYVATDELIHLVEGYPDGCELRVLAKMRGLDPQVTLARSATGRVIELYRRRDVAAILAKPKEATAADDAPLAEVIELPRQAERRVREATEAAIAGLVARCGAEGVELAGWRCLLELAIEELGYSALADERIASLTALADGGSLYEIQAGVAEALLAYAAARRPGEVHPSLARFAEIHGVAMEAAAPAAPADDVLAEVADAGE